MLKQVAVTALAQWPVWSFLRRRAVRGSKVTVLCYHTLSPQENGIDGWTALRVQDFQDQLADLRAYYDITNLDDAFKSTGKRPKAVITFDDGDRGLYLYLKPILEKMSVPVTIYVATRQFETERPFWFDRVVNALQSEATVTLGGKTWQVPARPGKAKWMIVGEILEALKQVPHEDRERLADEVAAQGSAAPNNPLGPMTKDELAELAAMPNVTIGAHSHGHELLDELSIEEACQSMAQSKKLLQAWTGQEVRHFAYPNGNYNNDLMNAAKEVGFDTATILEERLAPQDADRYALPRISIGRYDSRNRVRLRLAGF